MDEWSDGTRAKSPKRVIFTRWTLMAGGDPAYRLRRHLIQRIVALAYEHDTVLYRTLLGFPNDLPDLSRSLPPFNSRSEGIKESYFKKFQAGRLPEIY